jgi:hypothetical protein
MFMLVTDQLNGTNFLEKLIVSQLVKKSRNFMELEGSSPCSQGLDTGPYREPHESISNPHILFL